MTPERLALFKDEDIEDLILKVRTNIGVYEGLITNHQALLESLLAEQQKRLDSNE